MRKAVLILLMTFGFMAFVRAQEGKDIERLKDELLKERQEVIQKLKRPQSALVKTTLESRLQRIDLRLKDLSQGKPARKTWSLDRAIEKGTVSQPGDIMRWYEEHASRIIEMDKEDKAAAAKMRDAISRKDADTLYRELREQRGSVNQRQLEMKDFVAGLKANSDELKSKGIDVESLISKAQKNLDELKLSETQLQNTLREAQAETVTTKRRR